MYDLSSIICKTIFQGPVSFDDNGQRIGISYIQQEFGMSSYFIKLTTVNSAYNGYAYKELSVIKN